MDLWHSRVAKSKCTQHLDHYQLVLPDTMIKPVIQLYHDSPMSGHAGITDILSLRDTTEYLVQLRGEPAESAIWIPLSSLNSYVKGQVRQKPPPVIIILE